jgi:hypothetical protein
MPSENCTVVEVVSSDDWEILLKQFADANCRMMSIDLRCLSPSSMSVRLGPGLGLGFASRASRYVGR